MEINHLTPAERRVWRAFPRGETVDFRTAGDGSAGGADGTGGEGGTEGEGGTGGEGGAAWGPERTLRASVVKALLISGPQVEGEVPALRVCGARVTGPLDLTHAVIDTPVRLSHCHFTDPPEFYGAQLRRLSLRGSSLPALDLGSVRIEGVLQLSECRMRGRIQLAGAQIAGALFLARAELTTQDPTKAALRLDGATVGEDIWAPGVRATGEIRLNGATVNGSVDLSDARLDPAEGLALDAQKATVEGDMLLKRARIRGWIGLRGARVTGRLDLSYVDLAKPGAAVLRANNATVGQLWLRKGPPVDGRISLRHTQIDVLFLEPEKVPGTVYLESLVYTSLIPNEPAARRLPLVERDGDGYVPYAYEQLTAAYRRNGDEDSARRVQLAKQRRHRATLAWYGRAWGHVQDAAVGYGFRPLRACGWLLSLLVIGTVAFTVHRPRPLKPAEAPEFDPFFYTLDLLLPVISFGQEPAFAPDGVFQKLSYVLVLAGWILASTVIAGVTRVVNRQ
ncbi:membrane-associated oxidoreductase [Streptomyces sp. NPDC088789]|uniref:membrane-associated oxidoreductase n=1 Tax=Streptomyces sp. NPDC088789 TaxID=3365899 RepID=UPI00380742CE